MFKWIKRALYKKALQYWIAWCNWNLRKQRFTEKKVAVFRTLLKLGNDWKDKTSLLRWKADGIRYLFDSMKTTQAFKKDCYGDCDDFSWLAFVTYERGFILGGDKYSFSHFQTYLKGDKGHVVAVFDGNGKKIIFSNNYVWDYNNYHARTEWGRSTFRSEIRVNSKNKLYLSKII